MTRFARRFVLGIEILLLLLSGGRLTAQEFPKTEAPIRAQLSLEMPMAFEANRGQASHGVDFIARGFGYTAYLNSGDAQICLGRQTLHAECPRDRELEIKLVGSQAKSAIRPEEKLPSYSNYLFGPNPGNWIANVAQYAKVRYANVYPGIDIVYHGNQSRLEHDFLVRPGVDVGQIRMAFSGIEKMAVDNRHDLRLRVGGNDLLLQKPRAYQVIGGREVEVPAEYFLQPDSIAFHLGAYDSKRELIIDPVLVYATFLGGASAGLPAQFASSIAVDGTGNLYVSGSTDAGDFPVTAEVAQTTLPAGGEGAFVSKINSAGTSLIYSTYVEGFCRMRCWPWILPITSI